jgi:hypothetical protein
MAFFLFHTLRSVITYQAPGLPELGTVLNGTKCGNGMVRVVAVKQVFSRIAKKPLKLCGQR